MSNTRRCTLAALVAVACSVVIGLIDLGPDRDITKFLRVGEQSTAREFIEADLPDVELVSGLGHDGRANYVLAAVFPHLDQAEGHIDSVSYRSRRILYPALVSVVPRGMPLVVAMTVVNVAAIAAAAAAVAHFASRHRASWLAGAAVGLTPAFVTSMILDLSDALALALAACGLVAWRRNRSATIAVLLFTLAALARETTLVIPAAVFLAEGSGRRRSLLIPPAAIGAWVLFLEIWSGDVGKSTQQFRAPFLGWVDQGLTSAETGLAFVLVVLSAMIAFRLWPHDRVWSLVLLFDMATMICVDRVVLLNQLNLTRVTPWVLPLAILVLTAKFGTTAEADSTDEDRLDGERHTVGESLVDGTTPSYV